jgi:hypothetical protein
MYQDIFKEMMHYALLLQLRDGMEGNKWRSITGKSNYVRTATYPDEKDVCSHFKK